MDKFNRLLFLVPPRWIVEPIDQNAIVGHAVSVSCQAEGFPIPIVTWKQSVGELLTSKYLPIIFIK